MNRNIKHTWILSDLHLGSNSTALRRGFANSLEQDKLIEDNWRSTISKKDSVIVIGDISMTEEGWQRFLLLPGFKKLVLGNHDDPKFIKRIAIDNKIKLYGAMAARYDDIPLIITHIPVNESTLKFRFKYNLHGHDHSNTFIGANYFNFCIELLDFFPKKLDQMPNWSI